MSETIKRNDVEALVSLAIAEDIGEGDITSRAIFSESGSSSATIISKQDGVLCGNDMLRCVYEIIDPHVSVTHAVQDGGRIRNGDAVASISGPTISVLSGERIALNFMQRMTGIATRTSAVVSLLEGTRIQLLDTRKTAPGFRMLDKYAVRIGGGTNHRMGLYDMIMIKDNHIRAAGGVAHAVKMVRDRYGSRFTVEVEAADLKEVEEAVVSGADIIMLDNMDKTTMIRAVDLIGKRARIEVSGNMDEKRIKELRDLDVDYISMGSLTHSVTAFDLSMECDV